MTMRSVCDVDQHPAFVAALAPAVERCRERLTAVTYFGGPFCMARPFRWQRSSAASLEMNVGLPDRPETVRQADAWPGRRTWC